MKKLAKVIFGMLILANINTQYSLCKLELGDDCIVEIGDKPNAITKNSGINGSYIVEIIGTSINIDQLWETVLLNQNLFIIHEIYMKSHRFVFQ